MTKKIIAILMLSCWADTEVIRFYGNLEQGLPFATMALNLPPASDSEALNPTERLNSILLEGCDENIKSDYREARLLKVDDIQNVTSFIKKTLGGPLSQESIDRFQTLVNSHDQSLIDRSDLKSALSAALKPLNSSGLETEVQSIKSFADGLAKKWKDIDPILAALYEQADMKASDELDLEAKSGDVPPRSGASEYIDQNDDLTLGYAKHIVGKMEKLKGRLYIDIDDTIVTREAKTAEGQDLEYNFYTYKAIAAYQEAAKALGITQVPGLNDLLSQLILDRIAKLKESEEQLAESKVDHFCRTVFKNEQNANSWINGEEVSETPRLTSHFENFIYSVMGFRHKQKLTDSRWSSVLKVLKPNVMYLSAAHRDTISDRVKSFKDLDIPVYSISYGAAREHGEIRSSDGADIIGYREQNVIHTGAENLDKSTSNLKSTILKHMRHLAHAIVIDDQEEHLDQIKLGVVDNPESSFKKVILWKYRKVDEEFGGLKRNECGSITTEAAQDFVHKFKEFYDQMTDIALEKFLKFQPLKKVVETFTLTRVLTVTTDSDGSTCPISDLRSMFRKGGLTGLTSPLHSDCTPSRKTTPIAIDKHHPSSRPSPRLIMDECLTIEELPDHEPTDRVTNKHESGISSESGPSQKDTASDLQV